MIIKTRLHSIVLFLVVLFKSHSAEEAPVVHSNVGTIKGLKATDGDYYMYMGIPYAKVDPENPFAISTSFPEFGGTFQAYDDSVTCAQNLNGVIKGTIDCLNLNVYVPAFNNLERKSNPYYPVMIWIYGGAFERGHAGRDNYGPNYLVRHNVILVTINYRLGPFGFMCLDIPEVSGNQGLKDQYLAFKWVKENILAFGGDPNKITLFGQSAGGHSIDLHLMSNKDTLFNNVILQSGSALAQTVLYEPDRQAPLKMAKHLGFNTNDTREALSYLSDNGINNVLTAASELKLVFKPCVESVFDVDSGTLISKSWINNSKVPKVKDIPVLMGFNNIEMAYKLFPENDTYFNNLPIVTSDLKQLFNFNDRELNKMEDFVSQYYFPDEKITAKFKWDVIRYSSDFTYIHPIHRTMRRYMQNGAKSLYFYMFSYVGGRNAVITNTYDENNSNNHLCCASHSDELAYLFHMKSKPDLSDEDLKVLERMTAMWTNFAKNGDPNPVIYDVLPVKWKPVTENSIYYLNIDQELSLAKRPLRERIAFWELFFEHNKNSLRTFS